MAGNLPKRIRVNIGAPFPARVVGASFIAVSKANGIWSITPEYNLLGTAPSITATQQIAVYDTATQAYSLVPAVLISGAVFTVATLPAATAALKGARAFVSDASSPTWGGALTGGSSTFCPVFCNGSAWRAG
ncbi:MAG: hypothetical protein P4M05_19620 [Bradyrhizobium sp.]|nr:hypothetical protein [Bradyrhizobium sp.]